MKSHRDWSSLLPELLITVAEKLSRAEIASVREVCGRWAWALGFPLRGWPPPPYRAASVAIDSSVPWLLLPNEHGEDADYCSFLRLSDGGSHRVPSLPQMSGRRCVGSSPDGWLVTVDLYLQPQIIHPLMPHESFSLPSLLSVNPVTEDTNFIPIYGKSDGSVACVTEYFDLQCMRYYPVELFRDKYVRKVLLTSAPPTGFAIAILGIMPEIAIARSGDSTWSVLPTLQTIAFVDDAIFREDGQRIYIITRDGNVQIFDLQSFKWESPSACQRARLMTDPVDPYSTDGGNKHLVFINGDLMQISRHYRRYSEREVLLLDGKIEDAAIIDENHDDDDPDDDDPNDDDDDPNDDDDDPDDTDEDSDDGFLPPLVPIVEVEAVTTNVIVMKFDPLLEQGIPWVPVVDLGSYSIFVGCNHAMAINVVGKPGLRPNCVYFTDDSQCGPTPKRKLCLQDAGSCDLGNDIFHRFLTRSDEFRWPPPLWYMPRRLKFVGV
ncbi:hypothetical protein AXF42_Ash013606 [Apostasia shenzhenica]|uniref:KIB1-4 beta-propeller domain-containing protein n=1 Tax=Apostasia shenzhenica TaxID=1088818 RepID=A0A2I0APD6_9ASPA|nr:hypothetical protein AXF42_Ash013606 [Apostasia shenzhenica]